MVLHRHLRKSAQSFTVTSDKDVWWRVLIVVKLRVIYTKHTLKMKWCRYLQETGEPQKKHSTKSVQFQLCWPVRKWQPPTPRRPL